MSEHLPDTNYLDPEVLQSLGDLELVAREVVEGLRVGSHRSPLKGFSTEFAHHRQYSPGDEIRDIDWRVFGRLKALCHEYHPDIWHAHEYKSNFAGLLARRAWPMRSRARCR